MNRFRKERKCSALRMLPGTCHATNTGQIMDVSKLGTIAAIPALSSPCITAPHEAEADIRLLMKAAA